MCACVMYFLKKFCDVKVVPVCLPPPSWCWDWQVYSGRLPVCGVEFFVAAKMKLSRL